MGSSFVRVGILVHFLKEEILGQCFVKKEI